MCWRDVYVRWRENNVCWWVEHVCWWDIGCALKGKNRNLFTVDFFIHIIG
nr:MAG TPA: hypothetical protein [Caudoviricetes sp.]